jgi:hypothetical protein
MRIGRIQLALLAVAALALGGRAALAGSGEVLPPVNERFASEAVTEEPSFQRHVSPLFGRLGCNGRSCHGSFQGRGGFRLSLFGYDFKADHDELLKGEPLRANKDKPLESLILIKPTDADMHEGGLRYKKGGWEYQLFRRWIEGGTKFTEEGVQKLVRLEVTPAEILFAAPGEKVNLKAVAVWPDGSREDVTCLCRFTSNSDQVAKINADGQVTATDPGDTHVVVAYDNAVVAVPVIRPVSQLTGDKYPSTPTPTKVDELVVQKLKKLGVVQSDLCTDAEFLRRLSLDLTGTLPSAADVEAFLADGNPNKRSEKIEQLLKTPAYAAWWTTRLCDWTGNNDTKLNNVGGPRGTASQWWYDWIYDRVAKNVPYDKIAEGFVTAKSREDGESYTQYCESMSKITYSGSDAKFADRSSMPYYWARNNFNQPEDRAIGFAYTFLGIRIQCAQCHKHPFDQWAKKDFDAFKTFFTGVQVVRGAPRNDKAAQEEYQKIMAALDVDKELRNNQLQNRLNQLAAEGKTVPFPEIAVNPPRAAPARNNNRNRPAASATASVLGGEPLDLTKHADARQPLMDWLRSKDNPYFAKAFVNRVWANYFNVGIVQPPDDLSLANPPSNQALLDHLAQGFLASGFDMQWVHREICNSRTYQLSWQPNETNAKDERNFARSVPRRLPAEVAVDAISAAIASDEKAGAYLNSLSGRAIAVAGSSARANQGANNNAMNGFALQVFGRSIRESNCDCDRSMEASLLQTVYLQNDSSVLTAIESGKDSWIAQITKRGPGKLPDGSDAGRLNLPRELARMEVRLKAAREAKNADQVQRIQARIRELKQAEDTKQDAQKDPAGIALEPPALVRQAYLRTLSRLPTADELDRCTQYLAQAESPLAGAKGLLWTLINTKEFIVNH